jgi:hypothetical protein
MKLILFLGAGVSAPSGLPTAADLMNRIMRDVYHQGTALKGQALKGHIEGTDEGHIEGHIEGTDEITTIRRTRRDCSGW